VKNPKFDFEQSILFQNEDYVLINKPPFISTLEDRNDPNNILEIVRQHLDDPQVCHRLDKDTSGVLAIAKNPKAYRHLSLQFENRQVNKVYHAVADGLHQFQNKLVDASILKLNDGTVKIAREGKSAQTYFTTLATYKNHTLVECRPVTGRMHQIRIHLRLLKAPITGDEMYGGQPFFVSSVKRVFNLKREAEEHPLIRRMALHAFSLEFALLDGKTVKIEAAYPKDFKALVRQLAENKR
jgi:23S rRNA pseudouridine955/2504/2580 synthase